MNLSGPAPGRRKSVEKFEAVAVKPNRVALLAAQSLKLVDDPVVHHEFLEKDEALFGLQVGVAEHALDTGTFHKIFPGLCVVADGVGLGLFISKTIIEAHDEKIWVESDFGEDCCFYFTLAGE